MLSMLCISVYVYISVVSERQSPVSLYVDIFRC